MKSVTIEVSKYF